MTDRTDQPSAEQVAAALHVLADRITDRPTGVDLDYPDYGVLVVFQAEEEATRRTLVAGMTITEVTHLRPHTEHGSADLYRWSGTLLGMSLRVLGHPQDEPPAAAAQPAPQPEPLPAGDEAGPDDCTCWATSRNACPRHFVTESGATVPPCRACGKPGYHPDTCPTVPADTDPVAAADEQPAGPVSHWPINAPSVPRQRRTWLDRGVPAPGESSWARIGLDAVMNEPRPHARGLVPLTDPALRGRTDEVA